MRELLFYTSYWQPSLNVLDCEMFGNKVYTSDKSLTLNIQIRFQSMIVAAHDLVKSFFVLSEAN